MYSEFRTSKHVQGGPRRNDAQPTVESPPASPAERPPPPRHLDILALLHKVGHDVAEVRVPAREEEHVVSEDVLAGGVVGKIFEVDGDVFWGR